MRHKFKAGDQVRCVKLDPYKPTNTTPNVGDVVVVTEALDDEDAFQAGPYYRGWNRCWELVIEAASAPPVGHILSEALEITQGARNATHGDKERSFAAIAGLWNAYLEARNIQGGSDASLTARNVSDMMVLLKLGRSVQGQPIRDHYVDMAGYAALSGELAAGEAA